MNVSIHGFRFTRGDVPRPHPGTIYEPVKELPRKSRGLKSWASHQLGASTTHHFEFHVQLFTRNGDILELEWLDLRRFELDVVGPLGQWPKLKIHFAGFQVVRALVWEFTIAGLRGDPDATLKWSAAELDPPGDWGK